MLPLINTSSKLCFSIAALTCNKLAEFKMCFVISVCKPRSNRRLHPTNYTIHLVMIRNISHYNTRSKKIRITTNPYIIIIIDSEHKSLESLDNKLMLKHYGNHNFSLSMIINSLT